MKNKKAFTLIELIAVLVILAILTLIVTPLILNIIRKARTAADKRSIDAYGRSVELAIADYLLDKGEFPTSIEELTIKYTGDEVVCSTTQLNEDSTVYLAECTVSGREVSDYTYGKQEKVMYEAYSVGDKVTYNNVSYRVVKDSNEIESTVTLLKNEPLTVAEVNQYGVGHINRYTNSSQGAASNCNGFGGMAYYSSEECGYVNGNTIYEGCTTDYEESEVKHVVDAWKNAQAPAAREARLITLDEVIDNLGLEWKTVNPTSEGYRSSETTPEWLFLTDRIGFWIDSNVADSQNMIYEIADIPHTYGRAAYDKFVFLENSVIRPLIVLNKSALN